MKILMMIIFATFSISVIAADCTLQDEAHLEKLENKLLKKGEKLSIDACGVMKSEYEAAYRGCDCPKENEGKPASTPSLASQCAEDKKIEDVQSGSVEKGKTGANEVKKE
jgi:hypothetical protein